CSCCRANTIGCHDKALRLTKLPGCERIEVTLNRACVPEQRRSYRRVGLWRSWERASMAWKRSSVRSRPGPPTVSFFIGREVLRLSRTRSLRISPAGSRFADARKPAQIRSRPGPPTFSFHQKSRHSGGFFFFL